MTVIVGYPWVTQRVIGHRSGLEVVAEIYMTVNMRMGFRKAAELSKIRRRS